MFQYNHFPIFFSLAKLTTNQFFVNYKLHSSTTRIEHHKGFSLDLHILRMVSYFKNSHVILDN